MKHLVSVVFLLVPLLCGALPQINNALKCYQCRGPNCGTTFQNTLKPCVNNVKGDFCVTDVIDEKNIIRGCKSDPNFVPSKFAAMCQVPGCNNHPMTHSEECVSCSEASSATCARNLSPVPFGKTCTVANGKTCKAIALLNRPIQCFTYKASNKVVRGCAKESGPLALDKVNYSVCEGRLCNNGCVPIKCVKCDSRTNPKCANQANELKPEQCAAEMACFAARTREGAVVRGCGGMLLNAVQNMPCFADGCNSKPLPPFPGILVAPAKPLPPAPAKPLPPAPAKRVPPAPAKPVPPAPAKPLPPAPAKPLPPAPAKPVPPAPAKPLPPAPAKPVPPAPAKPLPPAPTKPVPPAPAKPVPPAPAKPLPPVPAKPVPPAPAKPLPPAPTKPVPPAPAKPVPPAPAKPLHPAPAKPVPPAPAKPVPPAPAKPVPPAPAKPLPPAPTKPLPPAPVKPVAPVVVNRECHKCDSKNLAVCATNPSASLPHAPCKDPKDQCVTAVVDGITHRGCEKELNLKKDAISGKCDSNLCNVKIFPENRLQCYQCQGKDCAKNFEKTKMPCVNYVKDDACVTDVKDESTVTRKCISDPGYSAPRLSVICKEAGCNNQPATYTAQCVSCSQTDANATSCVRLNSPVPAGKPCMLTQEHTCTTTVLLNRHPECFTYKAANKVVRGCLKDAGKLAQDKDNFEICQGQLCNNQCLSPPPTSSSPCKGVDCNKGTQTPSRTTQIIPCSGQECTTNTAVPANIAFNGNKNLVVINFNY